MTSIPLSKSFSRVSAVAWATAREALGSRLAWPALAALGAGMGLAAFLGEIALTETAQLQAVLAGEFYRLAAAFLLATLVITSVVREFNDKVLEFLLAQPITRTAYFFGKLAGFGTVALALSLFFTLPLATLAPPGQVALWGASLAMELLLLTAWSLLCALAFTQGVLALGGVAAFYFLARSVAALQLMANSSLGQEEGSRDILAGFIDLLALALPPLDRFARGDWLAYGGATAGDLLPLAAQGATGLFLAIAAGLFDFHRRNL